MMYAFIRRAAALGMTFVLLVALVLVGFGHRAQAAPDPADPALAAYIAAGGQLSDLCGGLEEDGTTAGVDCPACLITSGFALPDVAQDPTAAPARYILQPVAGDQSVITTYTLDLARASRAPPVV